MATSPDAGDARRRAPPVPTQELVEAVGRALGATRVHLLPAGLPISRPQRFRWSRRTYTISVDVPGSHPPRRLLAEFGHPPGPDVEQLAAALARSLAPSEDRVPRAGLPAPYGDARRVLRALARPPHERPSAVLEAIAETFHVRAGALALEGMEPQIVVHGPGRPVLSRAATEALTGPEGRIEILGRRFLAVKLRDGGRVLGGLALEDAVDSPELRGCVAGLAAALRPPAVPEPARPPPADDRDLVAAVTALGVPAFLVDRGGSLEAASPAAEELFSLSEFDLGRPVPARMREVVASIGHHELALGDRWFEAAATRLPSGARFVVLHDRGREEELRRTQEELVAAMSHELRTPIAGVRALLELLRLPAARADPERTGSFVAEGLQEIARLERLVEDLLLAARAATGGIVARPDTVRVRPVVDDVLQVLEHRYPDRHFEVDGDADALADPPLLRHAIWHLCDNAAKFGPSGGRVTVSIRPVAAGAEIAVSDEGPGIFSGDVPELFRPFRRLERNTSSPHGGAGVGLYLVKAVIEAQQGRVDVRARLGRGSTFALTLPAPS